MMRKLLISSAGNVGPQNLLQDGTSDMTPEPFVTADEIAAHLKVTRRQALEMTRRRIIPAYPLGVGQYRRVWRYKISEVERAIASGRRKPFALLEGAGLAETPAQRKMPVGSPRSRKGKL